MTAAWLLRSPPNWKVSETNQGVSLWRFHQRLTQLYRRSCRCMEHCRAAITSLLTDECIVSIYVTILNGLRWLRCDFQRQAVPLKSTNVIKSCGVASEIRSRACSQPSRSWLGSTPTEATRGYQGPEFQSAMKRILARADLEIVKRRTLAWLGRCRRLAKDWECLNRKALAFLGLAPCCNPT